MNLYVFGNEYLEEDSFARKLADKLDGFKIIHCRSPDDLLDAEDEEIIILDVVKGVNDVIVITDIAQLKTRNIMSLHDFDLAYFLKLMQELGMNKKIKIIGVPQKGDIDLIAKKVKECI